MYQTAFTFADEFGIPSSVSIALIASFWLFDSTDVIVSFGATAGNDATSMAPGYRVVIGLSSPR